MKGKTKIRLRILALFLCVITVLNMIPTTSALAVPDSGIVEGAAQPEDLGELEETSSIDFDETEIVNSLGNNDTTESIIPDLAGDIKDEGAKGSSQETEGPEDKKSAEETEQAGFSVHSELLNELQGYEIAPLADLTGNPGIIKTLKVMWKKAGSPLAELTPPYEISNSSEIEFIQTVFTFELEDNEDPVTGAPNRSVHEGDHYYIDLPDNINLSSTAGGLIYSESNPALLIASYSFEETAPGGPWRIRVDFEAGVDNLNEFNIKGNIIAEFEPDLSGVTAGESTTIEIPIGDGNSIEIEIQTPAPPATTPSALVKTEHSWNQETRTLVYNVRMDPSTGIFEGYTLTDELDSNLELVSITHGGVTLNNPADYTVSGAGVITYTIPAGRDGAAYQNIRITTRVKTETYASLIPANIENKATLTGGSPSINIESNTVSRTITPEFIGKTGTLLNGNQLQWTITANTSRQLLYDGVITDVLSPDLDLVTNSVTVGGSSITVYDSADTAGIAVADANLSQTYGVYNSGTGEFKVYLPRGIANASNALRTIIFTTDVDPNPGTGTRNFTNEASLTGKLRDGAGPGFYNLPTFGTGIIGQGVPDIHVDKGHAALSSENKRDGTIDWTIRAVSNHSSYQGSRIVDTLPADQSYVAGSIYLVGGLTGSDPDLALTSSTEPSAVISGNKLIITFETTSQALITAKTIRLQTKINEEIYGDNLSNRVFYNRADGFLYSDIGSNPVTQIATNGYTDNVTVTNRVIGKNNGTYSYTGAENPRINYSIAINENNMPLTSVTVEDDLDAIATQFRPNGEAGFTGISGVKWTYVPGTLQITRTAPPAGIPADSTDTTAIVTAAEAAYNSESNNKLTFNFGNIGNQYTITFTVELDVNQNDNEIFQKNGDIRAGNNEAEINGGKIKAGGITDGTGTPTIKNEVLGKTGTHNVDEQQITWTINLNQHKVKLTQSRVVDVLPRGLTLDPTSVRLYTDVVGSTGNFVTGAAVESATLVPAGDYTVTYELAAGAGQEGQYVFTVDLPSDEQDYILRFATDIDSSLLGQTIENSAYYEGQAPSGDRSSTVGVILSSFSGGNSLTKASVTVNKLNRETGGRVNGAVFELIWLRNGTEPVSVRSLSALTNGSVTFYGLTIGEEYRIQEVSAPDGYELDAPFYEFTAASGPTTSVDFSNTPIKTGSWAPRAVKQLTGTGVWIPFNFEISDETDETVITGVTDAPLGGNYSVKFDMKAGIDEKGILEFEDSYTFPDSDPAGTEHLVLSKTFTMKEEAGSSIGYIYDTKEYTLDVEVYNVKGASNLKVLVKDENGTVISDNDGNILSGDIPIFENHYNAEGVIQFVGRKTLEGHSLVENQFQFELYEGEIIDPAYLKETVGNKASNYNDGKDYSANIEFTPIEYEVTDVGTKIYTIVEKQEVKSGYTYDTAIYKVEVEITHVDGNGIVESTVSSLSKIVEGNTETADNIQFTNSYATTDTEANITGTKILSGDTLKDQDFSFRLTQVSSTGNFIREIETVKNNKSDITFDTLTFTQDDKDKTFYYQVTEAYEDRAGYDFDDSIYTVEIRVIDNNDGTLSTEKTITKDGEEVSRIVFQNKYSSTGRFSITALKKLTGKTLEADQFSFEFLQVDALGGAAVGEKSIVKNDGEGKITFPELSYTEADGGETFYYKISEVDEKVSGYTYDTTEYTVKITVKDNKDGTLTIGQEIVAPENVNEIIFTNSYQEKVSENNNSQSNNSTDSKAQNIRSPKTGDSLPIIGYVIAVVLSFSVMAYFGYQKLKRKKLETK